MCQDSKGSTGAKPDCGEKSCRQSMYSRASAMLENMM